MNEVESIVSVAKGLKETVSYGLVGAVFGPLGVAMRNAGNASWREYLIAFVVACVMSTGIGGVVRDLGFGENTALAVGGAAAIIWKEIILSVISVGEGIRDRTKSDPFWFMSFWRKK